MLAAYFNEALGLARRPKRRPPCGVAQGFGLVEGISRVGVLSGVGAGISVDNDVEKWCRGV